MKRLFAFWLLLVVVSPLWSAPVSLHDDYTRLSLEPAQARILSWEVCYRPCAETSNPAYRQQLAGPSAPLTLEPVSERQQAGGWRLVEQQPRSVLLEHAAGGRLRLALQGRYGLRLHWQVDGEASAALVIGLAEPAAFDRGASHGFAASHERILPILLAGHWRALADFDAGSVELADALQTGDWAGYRNRFWALLARPSQGEGGWSQPQASDPRWRIGLSAGQSLEVYAGPLSHAALSVVDPRLTGLLFDGLWFWMRWLSLGLLFILNFLGELMGNWGLAILALSVVVKILMTPLNNLADRWQAQVNRIQSQLHPKVQAIKREFRGEEQHNRILAAHKDLGVTPFYTLKSAFGFLIQIPVFIAAFNVLNEAVGLSGVGFLWIDDLARPDHLFRLPMAIPFFGEHFNLMPVIMTVVTLLASWQFDDASLSDELKARQRRNLYLMAGLFFVLFYTFPAGMVLYWTMNNLLQYAKDSVRRLRPIQGERA